MGWEEVWRMAMKHFIAEPVELRILIGLALLFLALMVIVGLKHAFRPAGPHPEPRLSETRPARKSAPLMATPVAVAEVTPTAKPLPQPFRVNKATIRASRKSVKRTMKPFAPPRPQIHRADAHKPRFTEEHAPYSPLPPRG
jgi:membrane-associated phospholipid phosphatase